MPVPHSNGSRHQIEERRAPAAWRAAQATLERRENQWKSQKIDSYDIVVNRVGTWIQLAYEGSVRQGHLVEATRRFLFPLNAEKMPLPTPALATIEGLFADAHRFLEDRDYGAYTTVTYDVSYRVPRTIIYEPPEGVFDADRYITLERFQPIK